MRSRVRCGAVVILTFLSAVATVSAQVNPTEWRRGTTLNVFGGVAAASDDSGPLAGGAFGWEVTPRFGLEASGAWTEWGHDSHGFDAALRALVALRPSRTVAPFLSAGAGLHRAWFKVGDTRVPEFYTDRVTAQPDAYGLTAGFTDPSLVFGGGVSVFVSRQMSIRPEVDTTIAIDGSRAHTTATARVHFAYHFEDHPITSSRSK